MINLSEREEKSIRKALWEDFKHTLPICDTDPESYFSSLETHGYITIYGDDADESQYYMWCDYIEDILNEFECAFTNMVSKLLD